MPSKLIFLTCKTADGFRNENITEIGEIQIIKIMESENYKLFNAPCNLVKCIKKDNGNNKN